MKDTHVDLVRDLSWYSRWVFEQIQNQPNTLYSAIPKCDFKDENAWMAFFSKLWQEVSQAALVRNSSVNSIIEHLSQLQLIQEATDEATLSQIKNLVFSIIGWQTMLYKPDNGSCNLSELAIADETDGYRCASHFKLRQNNSHTSRPLDEFLHGFGLFLPSRNFFPHTAGEDDDLREILHVSPTFFNAKLLNTIGKLQIRWTDVLACHLELDVSSNALYIYRYPSFCLANLFNPDQDTSKTTLQACTGTSIAYWANTQEVNDLLRETLLSYRLLFGQSKASRKFFRTLRPFHRMPKEGVDKFLAKLCSRERNPLPDSLRQSETYDLRKDFPVLRCKIAIIANRLSNKQPRTWKQIWNDRRDSPNWYTFWALLLFGGVGMTLAFIQVMLQIIEIILSRS